MKCTLKDNRTWIPKNLHNVLQNNFCKFTIKQKKNLVSFISKLSKDGRLVIPKKFRTKLKNGPVNLQFKLIKNLSRQKSLIRNTEIDTLQLIPMKTISGFDILADKMGDKIFTWYFASKGRPNELILKRYLGIEFARLLGYYRSEGGKPRISKRRGREFSFTNKSIKIILDFISLFKSFASINLMRASIRYNPHLSKSEIKEIEKILIQSGLKSQNIKESHYKKIKEFVIKLYVTNSLLSEVIHNAENLLRKYLVKNFKENIASEYLCGVLSGDGSFYSYRDKNGSLHSRLQIFESNHDAIKDIALFLKNFGIAGNIKPAKTKMYIFTSSLNWNNLLILSYFDFFDVNREKINDTIKTHRRFRSLKYLCNLPKEFKISEIKSIPYTSTWVHKRQNEGLIEFKNNGTGGNYILTSKGQQTAFVLKNL